MQQKQLRVEDYYFDESDEGLGEQHQQDQQGLMEGQQQQESDGSSEHAEQQQRAAGTRNYVATGIIPTRRWLRVLFLA
jgi:hypothetical protein